MQWTKPTSWVHSNYKCHLFSATAKYLSPAYNSLLSSKFHELQSFQLSWPHDLLGTSHSPWWSELPPSPIPNFPHLLPQVRKQQFDTSSCSDARTQVLSLTLSPFSTSAIQFITPIGSNFKNYPELRQIFCFCATSIVPATTVLHLFSLLSLSKLISVTTRKSVKRTNHLTPLTYIPLSFPISEKIPSPYRDLKDPICHLLSPSSYCSSLPPTPTPWNHPLPGFCSNTLVSLLIMSLPAKLGIRGFTFSRNFPQPPSSSCTPSPIQVFFQMSFFQWILNETFKKLVIFIIEV